MSTTTVAALERVIEKALMPGQYIDWRTKGFIIEGLHVVEEQIGALAARDPASAASVLESFIAAINAKMDEFDDDGDMGMVAERLFAAWVRARQASGAPATETIDRLRWWIEHDSYGLAHEIEGSEVMKALDAAGLARFSELAQTKLAEAAAITDERARRSAQGTWSPIHRAVLIAQRDVARFVDVVERDGVTPGDCQTIAELFAAEGRHTEALAWVTKGQKLDEEKRGQGSSGHELGGLQRKLLMALGRRDEALASAWAAYVRHPSEYTYADLMGLVADGDHDEWRARAMATTDAKNFELVASLLVKQQEIDRLAARVRALSDDELEGFSHFTTAPVADVLEGQHPDLAARLHAACGLRVVNRGKSRYYAEALDHLEKARDCYQRAGLAATWGRLVADVRAAHARKSGFMPGFEALAAGGRTKPKPSFLEQARKRFAPAD